MQKFCVICFGIHFRKAVREEENSPAYQGGNRGIHFGGLEEGLLSPGISGKCRRKNFWALWERKEAE